MKTIKIGCILFVIGIVISFILSTYIYYILEGLEFTFKALNPFKIYLSMKMNNFHFILFFSTSFLIFFVVILFFIMGESNYYKSELENITDTIATPRSVGQLQHGSARWLTKEEQKNVFGYMEINPDTDKVNSLIDFGKKDIKEVEEYKKKND